MTNIGNRIEAILTVNSNGDMTCQEARQKIDKMLNDAGICGADSLGYVRDSLRDVVKICVENGKKIHALKAVREATGWGLREAKDYVDQFS